jgi:hypothetical protein
MSPLDWEPTKRQPSFQHEDDAMEVEESALGTVSVVQ